MRRRPAANSSMSLFPFLDTLVCTMGALILMLLAMTPKIKERALARQAAAQAPAVEDAPEPVSEPDPPVLTAVPVGPTAEELAAERQRRRDAWLAQVADARSALGGRTADIKHRRQQLKDAEQQLRDLQDQVLKTQLKTESAGQATETLEERAQRLEAQAAAIAQKIAATRKNIDLANRKQASAKNEYALVAYDGVSGTMRRPIYIECSGKGFRFLPEGETLSPVDLEGFSDNFNPLLAGAQTLVRFWARRKRSAGPKEAEPYVLLLVRPSGCLTYYVARKYLSPLGVLWGYELIEEDWKLSVPEPDPVAKTMLKETLDATAQLRRPSKQQVASGDRDYGGPFDPREFFDPEEGTGRSFGGGGGGGGDDDFGFGRSGHGGGAGRKSPVKQGYATRNDRQGGDQFPDDGSFGSPGDGIGSSTNPGGGSATAGGMGSGDRSGIGTAVAGTAGGQGGTGRRTGNAKAAGISGGSRSGRGTGDGGVAQSGDGADDGASSFRGAALAANGTAGSGSGGPAGLDGKQSGNPGAGSAGGDPSTSGATGDGGATEVSGGKKGPGGSGRSGRARPASLGGSSDSIGEGKGGGDGDQPQRAEFIGDDDLLMNPRGGSGGSPGKGVAPGQSSGSPGPATTGQLNAPGAATADSSATVGATSSNSPAGAAGASGQSTPPPSWLSDPTDGSAATSGSPRARMGGPGVNVSMGGKKNKKAANQDDDDNGPRIPEDQNGKPTNGPTARSHGPRKWGQVGRKAGIGFEKKVKIYLNDKRIVVDNKSHMFLVTPADSNEEIINHVVSSIDEVADGWGEPPSNFYWVPVVQFVVYPGGNANYARLQTALDQRWGVTSTVEYAADSKNKKPATGGRP